jgi:hypothetical protein
MKNKYFFTSTQRAILVLLRSEDKNHELYSPIPGNLHVVKELFAICQTDLGKRLIPELKFEPDNFGPFDETIFDALDALRDGGFISFDATTPRHRKIKLTDKGKAVSDDLWDRLKDDVKTLFYYAKVNFNHLNSEQLLDKIYSAYPEMARNSISKVANKYRSQNILTTSVLNEPPKSVSENSFKAGMESGRKSKSIDKGLNGLSNTAH